MGSKTHSICGYWCFTHWYIDIYIYIKSLDNLRCIENSQLCYFWVDIFLISFFFFTLSCDDSQTISTSLQRQQCQMTKAWKTPFSPISVQYWNAFHGADGNFRYLHHCPISPDALCGIAQLILETIYHLNLLILPMLQRAQKWFLRSQKQIASLFYLLHAFVIYVNLGILIQADSPSQAYFVGFVCLSVNFRLSNRLMCDWFQRQSRHCSVIDGSVLTTIDPPGVMLITVRFRSLTILSLLLFY